MALNESNNDSVLGGFGDAAYLTPRQAAVLELAASGLSDKQIATKLGLSVRTVRDRFAALRQRTGTHTRSELLACAAAAALVHPASPAWGCRGETPDG